MNKASNENIIDISAKKYHSTNTFKLIQGYEGFDSTSSHLIKGYLPANAFGVIYGASGSFKSFHALSWACAIATGKDWNNHKVTQSDVLYIAGEGGIGVPRRIKAWAIQHNLNQQITSLSRINHPVIMSRHEDVSALIQTMEDYQTQTKRKFGLLIIDTLARCFGEACENKAEDMNAFIAACDRIKAETEATILVVHHSGKDSEKGARGSSALRAACDFEYRIDREERLTQYHLTCTKAKDDKEPRPQTFDLTSHSICSDEDDDLVYSLSASLLGSDFNPKINKPLQQKKPGDATSFLLNEITKKQVLSRQEARERYKNAGFNAQNFGRTLNRLIEQSSVELTDDNLIQALN